MSIGRCRLLTACYASDVEMCIPQEVAEDTCNVVRQAVPNACSAARGSAATAAAAAAQSDWLPQPLMFPPPCRSRSQAAFATKPSGGPGFGISTDPGSSSEGVARRQEAPLGAERAAAEAWELESTARSWASSHFSPGSRSWRLACDRQRGKVTTEKLLVKNVAEWGPQIGHLVDLRSGEHRPVTFWVRDDVRAFCMYDRVVEQVRVFLCANMEKCQDADSAVEVVARRFFLGISTEDVKRGLLITMEKGVHSIQVVHQGHLANLCTQLLLLCRDSSQKMSLLRAMRSLMAEMLVHERSPADSPDFIPLSEHRCSARCSAGLAEDTPMAWPPLSEEL